MQRKKLLADTIDIRVGTDRAVTFFQEGDEARFVDILTFPWQWRLGPHEAQRAVGERHCGNITGRRGVSVLESTVKGEAFLMVMSDTARSMSASCSATK